jgi:tetratricopeptide (TPR) repeat protein
LLPIWNDRGAGSGMTSRYAARSETTPAFPWAWALVVLAVSGLLLAGGCASTSSTSGAARSSAQSPDAEEDEVAALVKAQYAQALELLDAEDYQGARELLAAVIAAQPQLAGPRINVGIAYAREGDLEAAREALLGAVEQRPDAAEAWNELGVVYRRLGRFLSAQEAYETALSHAPSYAMAHFNLGVLFDLYLREPGAALTHYEQYRDLAMEPDARVDTWIADLQRRVRTPPQTAGVVDENL